MKNQAHILWIAAVPSILMVVLAALAVADSASVPNVFMPGQVANATHVNANFQECSRAIGDNDSRISALEQAPAESDRVVCGTIDTDDSIVAGDGFSVTVSRGTYHADYDITFDEAFGSPPVLMHGPSTSGGYWWNVEGIPGLSWQEGFRVHYETISAIHLAERFSFSARGKD